MGNILYLRYLRIEVHEEGGNTTTVVQEVLRYDDINPDHVIMVPLLRGEKPVRGSFYRSQDSLLGLGSGKQNLNCLVLPVGHRLNKKCGGFKTP